MNLEQSEYGCYSYLFIGFDIRSDSLNKMAVAKRR